jgi:hypothetical protein
MKISELISEQITPIGSTGSTAGQPGTVGQVSQQTPATPTGNQQPTTTDPNLQKLAATLKQNKVIGNDKEVNDFISAYQAQYTGKTLNTNQQTSMAKLAPALIKDRNLGPTLDLQLKTMSQQKPPGIGQPPSKF